MNSKRYAEFQANSIYQWRVHWGLEKKNVYPSRGLVCEIQVPRVHHFLNFRSWFWFLSLKWSELTEASCVQVRECEELVPCVSHCGNLYDIIVGEHAQYAFQTWHARWIAWLAGTVSVQCSYSPGCTNIKIFKTFNLQEGWFPSPPPKKEKEKRTFLFLMKMWTVSHLTSWPHFDVGTVRHFLIANSYLRDLSYSQENILFSKWDLK